LRQNKYLISLWERKLIQRNTNRNNKRAKMDMNIQEKEGPWSRGKYNSMNSNPAHPVIMA
jgi:hypothetical protein